MLHAWLAPMLRQAAFKPRGRALVVIDEIASHGEFALRERVLIAMEQFSMRLRAVLTPLLRQFSEPGLRARLRFISGSVLGPPSRIHAAQRVDGAMPLDDLAYLLPLRALPGRAERFLLSLKRALMSPGLYDRINSPPITGLLDPTRSWPARTADAARV